jgi:hypothetical protein
LAGILSELAPLDGSLKQRSGQSGKSQDRGSKAGRRPNVELREDSDRTQPQTDTDAHG